MLNFNRDRENGKLKGTDRLLPQTQQRLGSQRKEDRELQLSDKDQHDYPGSLALSQHSLKFPVPDSKLKVGSSVEDALINLCKTSGSNSQY